MTKKKSLYGAIYHSYQNLVKNRTSCNVTNQIQPLIVDEVFNIIVPYFGENAHTYDSEYGLIYHFQWDLTYISTL